MPLMIRSSTAAALLAVLLAFPMVPARGADLVDVSKLKPLGEKILDENPYRGDKEAIRIGASAYTQNCARCHGLEAVSGGMTPDLRDMPVDMENDKIFISVTLRGAARNGKVYMQPFKDTLSQEAIWAIRSYVDSRPKK
jgi:cytochrome c-550 PedF